MPSKLTFVGCGDAFGSGGRLNTCFHVATENATFLIDCGASSLIGMKRLGIDRNAIEMILVTHFHGDHFGGIPFFILDAQFFSKRTAPLTIAGPRGLGNWFERAMETAFAGSSATKRAFELRLVEIAPDQDYSIEGIALRAFLVRHGQVGGPFHGYRLGIDGKTLAFTGDTEWIDNLVDLGAGADLLISECYAYDKKVPLHLDYATLAANVPRIAPKRLILTHMNEEMLQRVAHTGREAAEDGMVVTI